ncbi:MAG: cellulase family glycosylhydrolase, partial [Phototrophicaceae bacterium]
MRRLWIVLLLVVLGSLSVAQAPRGVPDARYGRLARGINLPFWFWYGPGSQAGIEVRYSDEEFSTLAAVGVTFVRIPINLPFVHDENAGDHLNAANVALLKTQVQRVIDAGLAAIIDIHTTDEDHANFSWWLEHDPAFEAKFVAFWQDFAASMAATFSADDIFFEILNEPIFYDSPEAWPPIQAGLAAAIRT